jgi:VIT1/CCC1 family predicted Fe2+/Mn2+ transporter
METTARPPSHDPQQHLEEARRRAQVALYGARPLPGGYLAEMVSELLRGALIGGVVLAGGLGLSLSGPQVLAIFLVVVCAHALAEGVMAARASAMQIQFYRSEIQREAHEVEEDLPGERAELLALYEAKGLREPVLSQAVDQICADPETLLKVMMEEELGIFATRFAHPALQASVETLAAILGAVPVGVAFALSAAAHSRPGIPYVALGVWLASVAAFGALRTRHGFEPPLEAAAVNVGVALASGGFSYFLGKVVAAWLLWV